MKRKTRPNELPDTLTIIGLTDDRPARGLMVLCTLGMLRKNAYNLVFGPTDTAGKLTIARQLLEAEARRTRDLFPMDYEDLGAFAGTLTVGALSLAELDAALRAYELYHPFADFPAGYQEALAAARRRLADLRPARLDVRVTMQPETSTVRIATRSVVEAHAASA